MYIKIKNAEFIKSSVERAADVESDGRITYYLGKEEDYVNVFFKASKDFLTMDGVVRLTWQDFLKNIENLEEKVKEIVTK